MEQVDFKKSFTEREEEIISETLKRAMVILPEVIGNLMVEKETTRKIMMKFFDENKEFVKHPDVIGAAIEEEQNGNPGLQIGDWLENAKPTIKKRIDIINKSKFSNTPDPPNTAFNGVI